MIKNYIFDFGNVIAHFHPEDMTRVCVEDEKMQKYISEVVFDRLYWDRLDRGTITDDEVKEGIRSRMPTEYMDIACTVYDRWMETMTPVDGMDEIIREVRKKANKMFVLSDISRGFAESYHTIKWIDNIFSNFDGFVFSGLVGITKPDVKIFEHLIRSFDLVPGECLFIDDNPKNIAGAESAGINGYVFDGDCKRLAEFLEIQI